MTLSDLTFLLPEIILLLTAAVVFGLDLAIGRRDTGSESSKSAWLPYVALLGLGLALIAVIPGGGPPRVVATMLAGDGFAIFFKALAILAVAVVILTAIPYLPGRTASRGEFYALMLIVAIAICLAVSATNLVMLYLSFEFLSITSYVLVGYLRRDRKSGEAALKYFLYGSSASAVMLYGMSLLYGATGTTDLAGIAAALANRGGNELVWLGEPAIVLLLVGFGFKASLVPFHQWAPDTYEGAPTPVTAFLSTASKATGFAVLMRVFLVALDHPQLMQQWTTVLVLISILTMTIGNLTALRQTNIKRLLAYSSIAQAGYILMGVAAVNMDPANTFTGINGVMIYLFAYLFTNIGAFAVVTAYETATGKVDVQDYAGMIYRSPWLAGLLVLFLVSLTGIPPTGGFLGKVFVFGAAVQQEQWLLLLAAGINSAIAAFYYLNIVRHMFFTPHEQGMDNVPVSLPLRGALLVTGALTLLLGFAPQRLIEWASAVGAPDAGDAVEQQGPRDPQLVSSREIALTQDVRMAPGEQDRRWIPICLPVPRLVHPVCFAGPVRRR